MSKVYVYSTLTRPQRYTNYVVSAGGLPVPTGSVLINGGANLIDKHFVTPRGVVTEITDSDYQMIKDNEDFKRHIANGFLFVDDSKHDVNEVADDLVARDESAPLVPDDFDPDSENNKPPVVATDAKAKKIK